MTHKNMKKTDENPDGLKAHKKWKVYEYCGQEDWGSCQGFCGLTPADEFLKDGRGTI